MPMPWDTVPTEIPVAIFEDGPDAPAATLTARFEGTELARRRFGRRPVPVGIVRTERPIGLAIGTRDNFDGTTREILRFLNAVSGKENFTLDEGLCAELSDLAESGKPFRLCDGVPGERPSCEVDPAEVLEIVASLRPGLVADRGALLRA